MRAVVQRVTHAQVSVDGEVIGAIGPGVAVLLGVGPDDDEATARRLADRVATLRIHADEAGRMNPDPLAPGGAALVISQFTLYPGSSRGHPPAFTGAGPPPPCAPPRR